MSRIVINFLHARGMRSRQLKEHLAKILKKEIIPKRKKLLEINEVCERVWFIEKGLFRGFLKSRGRQKNEWFMKEGDVMFAPLSFYTSEPSEVAIEALEDSIVYSISIHQLEHIYRKFPEFERVGRKLTEKYYMKTLRNAAGLRESTIKARYTHFLKVYPELDARVPAVHIASFLGCSEEAFVRVRKKFKGRKG